MEKSPDAFRTISEVAEHLETPAHVLRFWESRFPQIRPVKRAGGRRYYRPADVALLAGIRRLLHDEGLTIRGVQKMLREQGVRHVAGLGSGGALFEEEADLEAQLAAEFGPAGPSEVPQAEAESATIVALETALMRARARDGAQGPAPAAAMAQDDGAATADRPGLDAAAGVEETADHGGADPWAVPQTATEKAPGPDMAASPPTQPDLWDAIAAREAEAAQAQAAAPASVADESQGTAEALPLAQRIRALSHGARLTRQAELRALRDRLQLLRDRLSGPVRGATR